MTNANEAIITAVKLTHTYASADNPDGESGGKQALCGVDMEIKRGEFVAILGHNGSGKSTLARHFNALLKPESGTVFVESFNTADDDSIIEVRRRVGMVFQNPDNQIVANVVEEDVAFAPENLGVEPSEIRRRVDAALRTVGMYEYREHAPHLLSGGQKQRVAIAGALAMQPECIVFDEPTAMLDPQGREDVIAIIKALRDELGVTIILITHHMEEAINCDRIFIMNEGTVVKVGTPQEIFREVRLLRELGLDVPDTVELLFELNQAGFNLPLDALSEDEAAAAIALSLGVSR
jgi:energy-coupling factor transport system ATP-binding protein